jgi:hypothetical protein
MPDAAVRLADWVATTDTTALRAKANTLDAEVTHLALRLASAKAALATIQRELDAREMP